MRDFDGKVAVVTGGASGMGKAFAERFARAGMKLVLFDYEQKALDATVRQFRQQEFDVLGLQGDVSKPEAVDELARKAVDTYGKVHILCNNAGVVADGDMGGLGRGPRARRLWEHPLSDWQWTFNVNFWGVVNGIRTFLPIMLAQDEDGHIVNTASIAGLTSGPGLVIYGATKHAVVRITEGLFSQLSEMGSKIKVSVLCPGPVQTRIVSAARNRPEELAAADEAQGDEYFEQRDQAWADATAQTIIQPAEVAEKVFKAIEDEQFYILPHEDDRGVRVRMENILGRLNPSPGRSA